MEEMNTKMSATNEPFGTQFLDDLVKHLSIEPSIVSRFTPTISPIFSLPSLNGRLSASITASVLAANHTKYHCFFNEKGFHNHIVHHVLAMYSLGAGAEAIKAAFDREATEQRPIMKSISPKIDRENWTTQLGDENYYYNYLVFFGEEIANSNSVEVIEKYVFRSPKGDLLSRSFCGLLHPLIHWGYGLEFKIDAIVAEGLAIAAVHKMTFQGLQITSILSHLRSILPISGLTLAAKTGPSCDKHEAIHEGAIFNPKSGLTALQIVHEMAKDDALSPTTLNLASAQDSFSAAADCPRLSYWYDQWVIDMNGGELEINERSKELIWLVVVLYATTLDVNRSHTIISFAIMHLVTSILFLPSITSQISSAFHAAVLKSFFRVAIAVWIAVGRPELPLSECMQDSSNMRLPDSQHPSQGESPWLKVISSASRHQDEHVTKVIRALAYFANVYGNTPRGYYRCDKEGSGELDSTIFLKAAVMTMQKNDWEITAEFRQFKWF